jgi:hypothetical protein
MTIFYEVADATRRPEVDGFPYLILLLGQPAGNHVPQRLEAHGLA